MKKNKVLIAITVLMILCLTGCNKEKENSSSETSTSLAKDYVYSMQPLVGDETVDSVNSVLMQDEDTFYAYGYEWLDNETVINFYPVNLAEGSLGEKTTLKVAEDESYNDLRMDADGNLYCIKNVYEVYDDDNYTEKTSAPIDDYYMVKMKMDGTELFSVKLNDLPELKKLKEESGYFFVNEYLLGADNSIYVFCMDSIAKLDAEGNFQKIVGGAGSPLADIAPIQLRNGKTIAIVYDEAGISIAYVDLDAGTLGEKYKVPGLSYEYSFYPGVGYDLYMVNSYGIFGYNIGDTDKVQLLNYVDSDFAVYSLYGLQGISETEFIALYDDDLTGQRVVAKFTKVPPEEIVEKEVLTLAMGSSDWSVRSAVIKFNKSNEKYRITIQDYASLYGSEEDYSAGVTRLNTDIISGKVPDILLINDAMPVDSYMSKGLFEDLKPYMEQDEALDLNNFMPNIIEAFSKDDKLYRMIPSYTVQTLVAKASDVGTERGWTVQEAQAILATKPEGTQFMGTVNRLDIINYSMYMASNQFVDLETGKCTFNSEGFIELLEFANTFPEEVDGAVFSEAGYWDNYESMWREGKVLTSMNTFGDFRSYNYAEKGTFGEKITLIGFPSANEDGSTIIPTLQLAMSSKSAHKEGVWEFLRTFLTDEYQESDELWGFPLSIKALDKRAEIAQQKSYYLDENNNKIEYDDTYYINGMEIIIDPMTREETDALKEQLFTLTHIQNIDESLLQIIQEETAPYFAGQKTAKDVADIIQSRAQIYVNENR